MIQIVIFDIGRVLVEWEPEQFYAAQIGSKRAGAFFANVPMMDRHFRSDAGENFYDVIEETAQEFPDWATEIHMWADRWAEFTNQPIALSGEIKAKLMAKNIPVWGLSNFGVENYPVTRDQIPSLQNFDRLYLSGDLKLVKPDPAIYAYVEKEANADPSALFFIDDTPANIEAAAQRGWQTHLFRGAAGLLDDLIQRGLLSTEDFK
ncbi:MAG: HAD-IA family hydrolase [Pseudomonadota bacterium]